MQIDETLKAALRFAPITLPAAFFGLNDLYRRLDDRTGLMLDEFKRLMERKALSLMRAKQARIRVDVLYVAEKPEIKRHHSKSSFQSTEHVRLGREVGWFPLMSTDGAATRTGLLTIGTRTCDRCSSAARHQKWAEFSHRYHRSSKISEVVLRDANSGFLS
ncbi:hypothetical protein RvY_14282 [Ramazzottius varieornatus]|uniref:Uncharacterized protein n=1 Tax=Ramazzottius varieornatus TaxID=947166 RepID=A0A1D1VVU8_RAMVA|nr:hypothetical protein RvY_14282 [Ramazzottius varieornatus]